MYPNVRKQYQKEMLQSRLIIRPLGMRTLGRFLSSKLLPQPEQTDLQSTFVERWAENDARAYSDTVAAVSRWSVRERPSSITCPTCVVTGENDFFPISLKEEYAARNPNSELVVVSDPAHFTSVDQPKRFDEALMSYIPNLVVSSPSSAYRFCE